MERDSLWRVVSDDAIDIIVNNIRLTYKKIDEGYAERKILEDLNAICDQALSEENLLLPDNHLNEMVNGLQWVVRRGE